MNRNSPATTRLKGLRRRAFTLIELLASMTILTLLFVMVASIMNSATKSSNTAQRRMDTAGGARTVFAQIRDDLATLVTRGGTTLVVGKNLEQNDVLAFIGQSRSQATVAPPRLTGLFYAMRPSPDSNNRAFAPLDLVRGFLEVAWDRSLRDEVASAYTEAARDGAPPGGFIPYNRQPTQSGILRFAVVLQLNNGQWVNVNAAPRDMNFPPLPALPSGATPVDLTKVRAITIGVALLDDTSRTLTLEDFQKISDALPRPIAINAPLDIAVQMPVDIWQKELLKSNFETGFSAPARQATRENLRFYQQTFPILAQ